MPVFLVVGDPYASITNTPSVFADSYRHLHGFAKPAKKQSKEHEAKLPGKATAETTGFLNLVGTCHEGISGDGLCLCFLPQKNKAILFQFGYTVIVPIDLPPSHEDGIAAAGQADGQGLQESIEKR